MRVNQVIIDFIRESLLTTEGDIIIRGAAAAKRLASVSGGQVLRAGGVGSQPAWAFDSLFFHGIRMGSYTRNSAGDEVVSGLAGTPSLILFLATCSTITNAAFCVGFDDGTSHVCGGISDDGGAVVSVATHSSMIKESGGNYIQGVVSAITPTDFTVTHIISGTASMDVHWLAIG